MKTSEELFWEEGLSQLGRSRITNSVEMGKWAKNGIVNGLIPIDEKSGGKDLLISSMKNWSTKNNYANTNEYLREITLALIEAGANPLQDIKYLCGPDGNKPKGNRQSGTISYLSNNSGACPLAAAFALGDANLFEGVLRLCNKEELGRHKDALLMEDGSTWLEWTIENENKNLNLRGFSKGLLMYGWDPNKVDSGGNTLLHRAKTKEAVDLLLAAGAKIDKRNRAGATPWETWVKSNVLATQVKPMISRVKKEARANYPKIYKEIRERVKIEASVSSCLKGYKTGVPDGAKDIRTMENKPFAFSENMDLLGHAYLGFILGTAAAFGGTQAVVKPGALEKLLKAHKQKDISITKTTKYLALAAIMSETITFSERFIDDDKSNKSLSRVIDQTITMLVKEGHLTPQTDKQKTRLVQARPFNGSPIFLSKSSIFAITQNAFVNREARPRDDILRNRYLVTLNRVEWREFVNVLKQVAVSDVVAKIETRKNDPNPCRRDTWLAAITCHTPVKFKWAFDPIAFIYSKAAAEAEVPVIADFMRYAEGHSGSDFYNNPERLHNLEKNPRAAISLLKTEFIGAAGGISLAKASSRFRAGDKVYEAKNAALKKAGNFLGSQGANLLENHKKDVQIIDELAETARVKTTSADLIRLWETIKRDAKMKASNSSGLARKRSQGVRV